MADVGQSPTLVSRHYFKITVIGVSDQGEPEYLSSVEIGGTVRMLGQYEFGGEESVSMLPGALQPRRVTVKRPVLQGSDTPFGKWCRKHLETDESDPKTILIFALTPEGSIAAQWRLESAWPVSIEEPIFDAESESHTVEETIQIVCNGIKKVK